MHQARRTQGYTNIILPYRPFGFASWYSVYMDFRENVNDWKTFCEETQERVRGLSGSEILVVHQEDPFIHGATIIGAFHGLSTLHCGTQ